MIDRRRFIGMVATGIAATVGPANGQSPGKVWRIGYLSYGDSPGGGNRDPHPMWQRLRELGYVEGVNLVVNSRYAEGKVERLPELAADLIRLYIRWYGHTSFNLTRDEKMLDLMAESGCIGVNIGFESLSQTNIDRMHKSPNRTAQYGDCIRRLHEREIGVMGTFMVGFDDDTPEVFDQIVDFAVENRLETAFVLILTPMPGTKLFEQMRSENRIFSHDWFDYDQGTVTFFPKNMVFW